MKYSFPSEHLKLDVLALILVVCITIFNATLSCAIHLKTGNDTLASYKAVHSFKQGAAFNHIRAPDPNDLISTDLVDSGPVCTAMVDQDYNPVTYSHIGMDHSNPFLNLFYVWHIFPNTSVRIL